MAIEKIKNCAERSQLCWEMARDTADSEEASAEYESQAESCAEHYADSIAAIERGDFAAAKESLRQAESLEDDGGDGQHARDAQRVMGDLVIAAVLKDMALSTLSLDGEGDDRTLSEAIPVPLAQQLRARLEAAGVQASWAPDNDDADLAWVYC